MARIKGATMTHKRRKKMLKLDCYKNLMKRPFKKQLI